MRNYDLTVITKHGGPLTKRIHLDGDHLSNDSSACVMSRGRAERFQFDTAQQLADLIGSLGPNQAREGAPAWALLDFDKKGMPESMAQRLAAMGGVGAALVSIIPEIAGAARVERQ